MPGGRPTEYTPDLVETARAYLTNYKTEHEHAIPSVAGLCKVLKRARSTLYKWAEEEDKQEFSDILEDLKEYQHETLVTKGLEGDFNSTIAKLILTKHGYSDKQETTHDVPEGVTFNMSFGNSKQD